MTEQPKSKKRLLMIRKYSPPNEVKQRLINKDKERPVGNKLINWVRTFLGEGF